MKIEVKCPKCGAILKADESHVGKRAKCPKCGAVIAITVPPPPEPETIPLETPAPAPPPPPPLVPSDVNPSPPLEEIDEAGGKAERVSCPFCAEMIMPEAVVCRFCGRHLSGGAKRRRRNLPALIGLILAILAWPVVALFMFVVFKQLIQSLIAGGVVAGAALICGLVGVILALRRRPQSTAEALVALSAAFLGAFCLTSFVVYANLAKKAADVLPAGMSPIKQIIGTEKLQDVAMRCKACGHEFEISSSALLAQQTADVSRLMTGTQDINKLLDDAEKQGAMGYLCPSCQKRQGFPAQTLDGQELKSLDQLLTPAAPAP